MYSESDLVKFGKYLLSKERAKRIKELNPENYTNRKLEVYDADIDNSGIESILLK